MDKHMKKARLAKILEIISKKNVKTQEALAMYLREAGYDVTQATVSRDIRELKLSKMPTGDGRQKYVALNQNDGYPEDKYIRVLKEGYLSVDMAQNILVIKTVAGMAMAVAAAIDSMQYKEVVGTIAGDDTIMMAIRTVDETKLLMERLKSMLEKS